MKEVIKAKQAVVNQISEEIKSNQSTVVFEYRGLSVEAIEELRRLLRKEDALMKVYKNTLVSRAAESLGYDELDKDLVGPNAVVFSKNDPIAGPRVLAKFARRNRALVLKGGIVEGKVLSDAEVKEIAALPGREGLLSMLLSCLNAPVSSFARGVKAVADAKENQ